MTIWGAMFLGATVGYVAAFASLAILTHRPPEPYPPEVMPAVPRWIQARDDALEDDPDDFDTELQQLLDEEGRAA